MGFSNDLVVMLVDNECLKSLYIFCKINDDDISNAFFNIWNKSSVTADGTPYMGTPCPYIHEETLKNVALEIQHKKRICVPYEIVRIT